MYLYHFVVSKFLLIHYLFYSVKIKIIMMLVITGLIAVAKDVSKLLKYYMLHRRIVSRVGLFGSGSGGLGLQLEKNFVTNLGPARSANLKVYLKE